MGKILWTLFVICFWLLFVYVLCSWGQVIYGNWKEYKVYSEFCETRPTLCYCGVRGCEMRTENEFSDDKKALCELAKSIGDKKTLFKVGCS